MSQPKDEYQVELNSGWIKKLEELEKSLPNMTLGLLENSLVGAVTAIANLEKTVSLIHKELSKREAGINEQQVKA